MHRRHLIVLIAAVLAVSACSGGEDERVLSTPTGVVADWLAAIETVDVEALAAATEPANLALVAGAENGFTVAQMEGVVDEGLPASTARSYWTTFRDGLLAFIEPPIDEMAIHDADRFAVEGTQFAAVDIRRGESTVTVITRLYTDGWKVDMTATVGPALAVQIRRLLADIVEQTDDNEVARRYARIAVGSLGAALDRNPDDRALDLEIDAIEDLPIDLGQ